MKFEIIMIVRNTITLQALKEKKKMKYNLNYSFFFDNMNFTPCLYPMHFFIVSFNFIALKTKLKVLILY